MSISKLTSYKSIWLIGINPTCRCQTCSRLDQGSELARQIIVAIIYPMFRICFWLFKINKSRSTSIRAFREKKDLLLRFCGVRGSKGPNIFRTRTETKVFSGLMATNASNQSGSSTSSFQRYLQIRDKRRWVVLAIINQE